MQWDAGNLVGLGLSCHCRALLFSRLNCKEQQVIGRNRNLSSLGFLQGGFTSRSDVWYSGSGFLSLLRPVPVG